MRPPHRTVAALAAAVLLAPLALAGPAGATPPAGPAGATPPAGAAPSAAGRSVAGLPGAASKRSTVTLITGDRVTLADAGKVTIKAGAGRSHVTFATSRAGGHLRIVPSDALPLLKAGKLDPRLFDVTTLIEFGYDDRRDNLPLILTGMVATQATTVRTIHGGTAVHAAKKDLGTHWAGLSAGVGAAMRAAEGPAPKIWLDGLRRPTLKESVPQIGAPAAWSAGLDGAGITVAVVDTGIDETHPDLAGRVADAQDFSGAGNTLDAVGHGTHVAATIGSTGAAEGGYKGVAPGASLLSAKVCVDTGCEESAILAGMQWAAEQGAKVVNMSLGGGDTPEQDPIEAAVERLTAEFGALFVISAGNSGADETIGSPGSADAALTVGAVDKSDQLAGFSSRGPRVGDGALKPDITAPGVDIVAANSKDGFLGEPGALHLSLSGTSMAAPHVAGSAAILAQQHPTWTPAQLKAALMSSARPKDDIGIFGQGAGRVDVAHAITQTVVTDPPSVSFGRQIWPHADDEPDARDVTYTNTGDAEVTLDLALTGVPAGLFTLSADKVTVPAGGTAKVTLTSDTRADVADGRYGGRIVATGGGASAVTPFAVDKEVESYDVTVDRLDRSGAPTADSVVFLTNLATGQVFDIFTEEATVTKRVPKGEYALVVWIYGEADVSMVVDPSVTVGAATHLTADARAARPYRITVPPSDAVSVVALVDVSFSRPDTWSAGFGLFGNGLGDFYVGQTDPAERSPLLHSAVSAQFVKGPLPEDAPMNPSPYAYLLGFGFDGHVPSGLDRAVTDRELATVETSYAGQGVPTGETTAFADLGTGFAGSSIHPVTLPGGRTDHFTAGTWDRDLTEVDGENYYNRLTAPHREFRAGHTERERQNQAVFGPGFSQYADVARLQDQIGLFPSLHSPGASGWSGFDGSATGRTVLERDGRVVFDEPTIGGVIAGNPAGEAAYKLHVEAVRGAPNTLSTSVSADWTFRSAAPSGDDVAALPVSAVRFTPPVDDRNRAPAGVLWAVPVEVQQQPGSAAGRARTLTVDVSFDDGVSWCKAPVIRVGQHGVVLIHHPRQAGYVSLRASSTDTAGNTVTQTVLRAYATG